MMRVRELMSTEVEVLDPDDDLDLAAMLMRLDRLRHLPVVRDGEVLGVVSDRDLLRAQVSDQRGLTVQEVRRANMAVRARDVMSTKLHTVGPETSALEAAELLREHRIGCLPVIDNGRLVGIVTAQDFLALVVKLLLR